MKTDKLAKKYGTTPRTIARWMAAGAPLNDESAMVTWLATRKNIPPGTVNWLNDRRRKVRAELHSVAALENLPRGAAAALNRLETLEANSYAVLERAMRGGDASEIKAARDGWIKVGDSLRRYDLLLANSGRSDGEVVKRVVVEDALYLFVHCLKIGLQTVAAHLAARFPDKVSAESVLENALFQIMGAASAANRTFYEKRIPEWVNDALENVANFTFKDNPERMRKLSEAFTAYVDGALTGRMLKDMTGENLRLAIEAATSRLK